MENKKRCVIIAASPLFEKEEIEEGDFVIACDGGYGNAEKAGIEPDLFIGDLDSYSGELPEKIKKITAPAEKEDTDTMLAVKYALKKGFKNFLILGATGGRIDHQIGNISAAAYIAMRGGRSLISDRYNKIFVIRNSGITIKKEPRTALSILSYTDISEGVTAVGTKYKLKNASLSNTFPLGISNVMEEENIGIEVKSGILLIILSKL